MVWILSRHDGIVLVVSQSSCICEAVSSHILFFNLSESASAHLLQLQNFIKTAWFSLLISWEPFILTYEHGDDWGMIFGHFVRCSCPVMTIHQQEPHYDKHIRTFSLWITIMDHNHGSPFFLLIIVLPSHNDSHSLRT